MDNLDPWIREEQAQIARLKRKLLRDFSLYFFLLLLPDIKIGIALVACAFTWTWSVPRILPEYVQRCEEYLEVRPHSALGLVISCYFARFVALAYVR
jgi:hypothetical protein